MIRPPLVDTHSHLTDIRFSEDFSAVVDRARQAGVVGALVVGTTAANSRQCIDLCAGHEWLFPTTGMHPCHLQDEPFEAAWREVEEMAALPQVRGLGETGLDNYWKEVPLELQREGLRRHLDLGRRLGKPVILHCREAAEALLEMVEEAAKAGPVSGVLHSFAGTLAEARRGLAAGLHISFSGMITYPKNEELRRVAAEIPADRVLIETDAPYLSPQPWRGKRNEPSFVAATCEALARARGCTITEASTLTMANACRLFRLDPPPIPDRLR